VCVGPGDRLDASAHEPGIGAFFDNYDKRLPPLAEQHGYIVVAPLGYRVDGSYGWGLGNAPADPTTRRTQMFSEQDVMQVLQRVRQLYKVDESRIYLLGHSMGALGTWKIAPKYPDIWAAIAPISGAARPTRSSGCARFRRSSSMATPIRR
jgi:poly(3-hydroxybutyrate) depolymerase